MNNAQKFIYWLDRKTSLFEKLETTRADWFGEIFDLQNWFKNNPKVIDIGSGVGDVTKKIVRCTDNLVVGIDIEDFRRIGNKSFKGYRFCRTNAASLPFKENSFDCVTAFWTLHHLPDPILVLNEMNRILKDDGQLIIIEDLIDSTKKFKGYFTKIYDKVINLEFSTHPHSNKSLLEWDLVIREKFNFKAIELREIPWFTKFKLLKFGLLRYRKN